MRIRNASWAVGALVLVLSLGASGCRALDSANGMTTCQRQPDARASIDCQNARREGEERYRREREKEQIRSDRIQG